MLTETLRDTRFLSQIALKEITCTTASLCSITFMVVNMPVPSRDPVADPGFLERGFICIMVWGFALLIGETGAR